MTPRDADYLLTTHEAAQRLSVSRTALYALIASGELPSLTIGRSRRIRASALREYVARREAEASARTRQPILTPHAHTRLIS